MGTITWLSSVSDSITIDQGKVRKMSRGMVLKYGSGCLMIFAAMIFGCHDSLDNAQVSEPDNLQVSEPDNTQVSETVSAQQSKEAIQRTAVSSSAMRSVGYDSDSNTLAIEFPNGAVYHYFQVPNSIYRGLMDADSHGRYFHQNIRKAGFEYERVGG